MNRRIKTLLGALTWCVCSLAQGQTDAFDNLDLVNLLDVEVVTASATSQRSSDAPSTVWAVSREQIQRRGYQHLEDLLEDIPEVEIQRRSSSEMNNHISIRGISGNEKFVILMDGFRVNAPTGTPHAVATNYSLANATRVEVILGPASALYGADAFSGIINIITRTGDDVDGAELEGSYGLYNTTDSHVVAGYELADDISLAVMANVYSSDEPDFYNLYPDDYAWYNDRYSQDGTVLGFDEMGQIVETEVELRPWDASTYSYMAGARLQVKGLQVGFLRHFERHSSSAGMKPEFNLHVKDARYAMAINSLYLNHNYAGEDDRFSLQSSLWYGTYELNPGSNFNNIFSGFEDAYKYSATSGMRFREQLTLNLFDNISVILGGQLGFQQALPKTGDLPRPFDPNESTAAQELEYIGTDGDDRILQDFHNVSDRNLAAYGQVMFEPVDWAKTTVGARYDHNTRYGGELSPRAGLVISPIDDLKIKLLYGEAFLQPSPYKTYQHYGSFAETPTGFVGPFWHLPNSDLEPEELRTLEASLFYFLGDYARIYLGGYATFIDNLITDDKGITGRTFKGAIVFGADEPQNLGESTIFGGSFRVDAVLDVGPLTLEPFVSYSFVDGELDGILVRDMDGDVVETRNNVTLPFAANHTIRAGLDTTWNDLSISVRGLHRSETTHPELGLDDQDQTNEAFLLLRAFARYQLLDTESFGGAIWVKADNILDSRYTNVSFASFEAFTATPQDPLRVLGGVSLEVH